MMTFPSRELEGGATSALLLKVSSCDLVLASIADTLRCRGEYAVAATVDQSSRSPPRAENASPSKPGTRVRRTGSGLVRSWMGCVARDL